MAKTLPVWSLLYYLTETEGVVWRQVHYDTNKMVHAVKGDEIKGYFTLKLGNKNVQFTQANIGKFMPVLYWAISEKIKELIEGDFTIVPIPNSSATIKDKKDFKTLEHARAIAKVIGARAKVSGALRWNEAKASARKGGGRDPQIHFENLRAVEKPSGPIVIFDDVRTSGSQIIGSYRRLAKEGMKPVCGVVIGRATKAPPPDEDMIGWHMEEVVVEETPIDWGAILKKSL